MLQFVTPANEHHALGQALALCAISPSYIDSELGLVVPRVLAAAVRKKIVFGRDSVSGAVVAFATYALLDTLSAQQWQMQTRAPGIPDFERDSGQCWIIDYVWSGDDGTALLNHIKSLCRVPAVYAVQRKTDYVPPTVLKHEG